MGKRMNTRRIPERVMKRDGAVVPFTSDKIQYAIYRAALEVLQDSSQSGKIARRLVDIVVQRLAEKYRDKPLHVEAIQDMVETVLMNQGYGRIAKSYILYRERRARSGWLSPSWG
jgi:anaerobic ribonucleoside-triphosphate reductase